MKKPPVAVKRKGALASDLFSGIFNVARNPVTNRHGVGFTPGTGARQASRCGDKTVTSLSQPPPISSHNILWVARMALIEINMHKSGLQGLPGADMLADGNGPVVIMTHGYTYEPGHRRHCPHRLILSATAGHDRKVISWPRHLGAEDDGMLALAYGWPARGTIWRAWQQAADAGAALARVITTIRRAAPHRPVHAIAHSLGARVVLAAVPHLAAGALSRVIVLSGAEYAANAAAALDSPAGRDMELINITSRENDLFDFLFERLVAPPVPGDRVIGHGLPTRPNALSLQIDNPGTLAALTACGFPIAAPRGRICHWSSYMRPGIFDLYRALLTDPDALPIAQLRRRLPDTPQPRWSRLLDPPRVTLPLPFAWKPSS